MFSKRPCETEYIPKIFPNNQVIAYRSLNGTLYENKNECARHDKIWKDRQTRNKVYDALKRCLDRPLDHYKVYYNQGMTVDEICHWVANQDSTGSIWRELRNALNSIED